MRNWFASGPARRIFRSRSDAQSVDSGASAVEYGLLVAAIAAIIILVVFALGTFVKGAFKDTCTAFKTSNAVNSSGPASNDCSQ
jgi:pilus assembly protein Flp/PilA